QLIEIGGEGLDAELILPVQQVAPRVDPLDDAFVSAVPPLHAITDHGFAFLAPGVAADAAAVPGLDQVVPSVGAHHEPRRFVERGARRLVRARLHAPGVASKASTLAAQMKSLI